MVLEVLSSKPHTVPRLHRPDSLLDALFNTEHTTGESEWCPLHSLVSYTNDCQSHHTRQHIIRFADDSVAAQQSQWKTQPCSAWFYGLLWIINF